MRDVLRAHMLSNSVDWDKLAEIVDDVVQVSPRYIGPELPAYTDIWGIQRRQQSYGDGTYDEIAVYPLAGVKNVSRLHNYPWPDPDAYDYKHFREEMSEIDPEGRKARKMAINVCGNPFEIYCWMTGLEEAMVNLALYPVIVHTAMDYITQFFEDRLRWSLSEARDLVDILYYADDLGGQQNLLMSLRTYRKMIKHYHARLFDLGHQLAPHAYVMYHSDGAVFDILPDLLDAGIDVLEAVQTDTAGMDPRRLKQVFGEKLSFHGGISVQNLLPFSHPGKVRKECQSLVNIFGKGGGYIAAPSHAIQVGTPVENVHAMLCAVLGERDYNLAIELSKVDS
jgi:uroporphyrinogen decarboxylase